MTEGISRLPPEALAECFVFVCGTSINSTSPYSWLYIMQVCKHWYNIAITCPSLWSYIDLSRYSLNIINLLLQRSGAVPLTLTFDDDDHPLPVTKAKFTTVLDQAHRIQSIDMDITLPTITQLISQYPEPIKVPILQSLKMTNNTGDSQNPAPLSLHFESPMTLLTSLNVHFFEYHHLPPLFQHQIRRLLINTSKYPSLDELLHDLQSMPALEVLELLALDPVFRSEGRNQLRLDRLQSLLIAGTTEIFMFLTRLVVPSISITLDLWVHSVALERERIQTIFDTTFTLTHCQVKSNQSPDDKHVVRSLYIELGLSYHMHAWSTDIPPTVDSDVLMGTKETEDDIDSIYNLSMFVENEEDAVDSIHLLHGDVDFSQVHTLILAMAPGWRESTYTAFKTVVSELSNTIETLIFVDWKTTRITAFLTAGDNDFKNTTASFSDVNSDTSSLSTTMPFPALHTISLSCSYDNGSSLPVMRALKFRAERGVPIRYLYVDDTDEDTRQDFEEALMVVEESHRAGLV